MANQPKFNIGSVFISFAGYNDIVKCISTSIDNKEKTIITYVNHHIYNICNKNEEIKNVINESDITHIDGIAIWFAAKILGNQKVKKFNWTDYGFQFLQTCAEKKWRIFFLGSRKELINLFVKNIKLSIPNLIIAGYVNGYKGVEVNNITDIINSSNADILWVGMGSPKQELWIEKNHAKLNVTIIQSVGGIFDYIAGKRIRGPKFIRHLGFEWLLRVLNNPKTYFRRYFFGGFIFIYHIVKLRIISVTSLRKG